MAVAVPTSAWALGTAATPHTGSIPTAVPGSDNAGSSSGSSGGGPGGAGGFSQITAWVDAHYTSATVGGATVYLLLQPKS